MRRLITQENGVGSCGSRSLRKETLVVAVASLGLLLASPGHAKVKADLRCKGVKARASAIGATTLLNAFSSNLKKPSRRKLERTIGKARSRFTKAFTRIESKGICATNGDAAAIAATVDDFAISVLDQLCANGTTTTTSTTFPSSTTSTTSTTIGPPASTTSTTQPTSTSSTTTTSTTSTSSTTTASSTSTTLPSGSLVLNEIDYDQVNADDREFVEIFNGSGTSVDLTSLAVVFVNGADGMEYRRVELGSVGSLPGGGYLAVASPSVVLPAGVARVDLPASSAIQNGPDGVALVDTASEEVLDVFSYEGEITAAILNGFSTPISLVEGTAFDGADSGSETASIVRSPNGRDTDDAIADWTVTGTPTPGQSNPGS